MSMTLAPYSRPPDGTVVVPGSKSVANRMLICASLASGTSRLVGLPDGDDTEALLNALPDVGVGIERVNPHSANVTGVSVPGGGLLWSGLAGTSSRFMIALSALGREAVTIDGALPLRRRPMRPLLDALADLGVVVATQSGSLPVTITGPARGGEVELAGDVSSQFISALMMIAPRLDDGLTLHLTSRLVSRPYVEMTASVMAMFGHTATSITDSEIVVHAGGYESANLAVEPDASSASYPMAIAAITGGTVRVPGLTEPSLQGDAEIRSILASMGCEVSTDGSHTVVTGPPQGRLAPFDLDMSDISDLVPTMAVLGTQATGPSRITGVGFIRAKESDRLAVLAQELSALGGDVRETADGLEITPASLHGASLRSHHDHRMAMAFGVLSTVIEGIEIDDLTVVSKSWPGYWDMIDGLRR